MRKHRELEGLSWFIGKDVHMELRGGTPLLRSRREIFLKGKIVDVTVDRVDKKTVTIEIPLIHVATVSEKPIKPISGN